MWEIGRYLAVVSVILVLGCDPPAEEEPDPEPEPAPLEDEEESDIEYRWMPDDDAEKFEAIEGQMGGFSKTMRRVGYRYNELYWAGDDENWDFAAYQLDKLESEVERGTVRRPAREASARSFLDEDVPSMREAIEAGDAEAFDEQFEAFTQACQTCHAQEGVAFIQVQPLEHRHAPVRQLQDDEE